MNRYTSLKAKAKMVILIAVFGILYGLPALCDYDITGEQSRLNQTTEQINVDARANENPALSDDPYWKESEGFSLYAAPEKHQYVFGEDIVINLKLKNETGNALKYTSSHPSNMYYFNVTDSDGYAVTEDVMIRMGSFTTGSLGAGKSINGKVRINRMFTFPSPGIYTARAYRTVRRLDGTGKEYVYSNKFSFEISGDPSKAKTYKYTVNRTNVKTKIKNESLTVLPKT